MITGNDSNIEPSRRERSPALVGTVGGEEGLHARPEEGEATGVNPWAVLFQRTVLSSRDLQVLFRELK